MQVRLILSKEGAQRLSIVQPEFPVPIQLGSVVGTEAAIGLLDAWNVDLHEILSSHRAWHLLVGEVDPDIPDNEAVHKEKSCSRLLSAFEIGGTDQRLWALTDLERDLTILLLPGEYRRNLTSSRR